MSHPKGSSPPPLVIVPSPRSTRIDDEDVDPESEREEPESLPVTPPPAFAMPTHSTLESDDDEGLEEKLFDLYGDIVGEEELDACQVTLNLVLTVVRCEAGAIATRHEEGLQVRVATGPLAERLLDRVVPLGTNAMSDCFAGRKTISVSDAAVSSLHLPGVDKDTGFECFAALCVPILDDEGLVYGVIELLNPTSRSFLDEDEEAIERIARVLGTALAIG